MLKRPATLNLRNNDVKQKPSKMKSSLSTKKQEKQIEKEEKFSGEFDILINVIDNLFYVVSPTGKYKQITINFKQDEWEDFLQEIIEIKEKNAIDIKMHIDLKISYLMSKIDNILEIMDKNLIDYKIFKIVRDLLFLLLDCNK